MCVFLLILSRYRTIETVLGTASVIAYVGILSKTVFVKATRETRGRLRFEGPSIVVRTSAYWTQIFQKVIEWTVPKVIVLIRPGTEQEPSSSTAKIDSFNERL